MASFQGSLRGANSVADGVNVESAEFPMVCETCLGPNPYVRMMREPHGKECKVCSRPFTVFRWKPGGADSRYKKTEVCQTCARVKNVCQTCLFDLQFGLPVAVRDKALSAQARGLTSAVPVSAPNREYVASLNDAKVAGGKIDEVYANRTLQIAASSSGSKPPVSTSTGSGVASDTNVACLARISRKDPYYARNRSQLCSFFAKGQCRRGMYCPYRHEMQEKTELSEQKLQDRYYGTNDPVADKIMKKTGFGQNRTAAVPTPPSDSAIKTLFVKGADGAFRSGEAEDEQELREQCARYGTVLNVRSISEKSIAFVDFATREDAEYAFRALYNKLTLPSGAAGVSWARHSRADAESGSRATSQTPRDTQPVRRNTPAAQTSTTASHVPTNSADEDRPFSTSRKRVGAESAHRGLYPSQNPNRLGAVPRKRPNIASPSEPIP